VNSALPVPPGGDSFPSDPGPEPTIAALQDLTGRTALVTGAASGIGLQTTRRLCQAGARVHGVDLHEELVADATAQLGALASQVTWHIADVTDASRAMEICSSIDDPLDVLVNNAGVYPAARLLDASAGHWDRIADVNIGGTLNFLQPAARRMTADGTPGSIINLASVNAIKPAAGFAHYGAAKAAIISLTRSSALELGAFGIRVNAIAPGGIVTPGFTRAAALYESPPRETDAGTRPLRRLGSPDDVARAVLFLASDLSSYMTGAVLVVDGGVTLQ
jgi:3-oxoacyl-[acyl-carrier protein] reductase